MSNISKAIIPAAGLGTRMQPISDYLPKPMLPLGKKPVLQHILDELNAAGICEIVIVARTEHSAIFNYFGDKPGIQLVEDNSASGPGEAILKANNFIGDESFAVVFSDAPVRGAGRSDHLKELMALKQQNQAAAVLSTYRIPKAEVSSRGVVVFEEPGIARQRFGKLADIIEKPTSGETSSRWASTCRYVLDATIFDALQHISTDAGGELQLTPAIRQLIKEGKSVLGMPMPGQLQRYDTGHFEGYFAAFNDFIK
ncbi:sugar phosphate nucleotidyltransferase [Fodinibius sp.]|uniref:sugar phosphate nucleotidyltransferase n=1 Tax=Fodinibius sp. TaxID=1872440 RepID=UPI002ACD95C0|nr:sugar phosphate nucleotidyltransferase [Fodinibius sp.]MDZ7659401.1 sugar phosphate nucleotidyltransferase [Fodinibius sp.]